jgi:selenophosphate synthetase-related protein
VAAASGAPSGVTALVRRVRQAPALRAKASIGLVGEALGGAGELAGPGDDGAVVETGQARVVLGGEAIFPPFVAGDPYGAGIAALLTNVNDLAAMGSVPLAVVDTIAGPESLARPALEGLQWASQLYRVPVVGGHLTITDGPPSLSAFGLGELPGNGRVLAASRAAAGQTLMLGCCLQGSMRSDFPFFPSFEARGHALADDVRLLAWLAEQGWVSAAKDVSMAGLLGSLGMLLEWQRLGVTIDLDALPVPAGVGREDWLTCFPCFAFLLCVDPEAEEACRAAFEDRGLCCAALGALNESGAIRLQDGQETATVFDLTRESVTNLPAPRAGS